MQARLVVYRNDKQELCVPVPETGTTIGRDAGNPVQLLAPEVSKKHASLQHTPKGWSIRDLNSRNGLMVNGRPTKEAVLRDGDKLSIGPYTLVFDLEDNPFKPVLQIDLSTVAVGQTMTAPRRKT